MSKQFGTKPITSNREEEAVRLVAERENIIARRASKIALKIFVFLFVFGLGFILSMLLYTDRQMDDFHLFVYAFDTKQKLADHYKMFERQFFDKTGLPPESPEAREWMALVKELGRPLVEVGSLAVFVNDNGAFSVREIQSVKQESGWLLPLIELENHEQSKYLRLYSSQEKGCGMPRFHASLAYSEDGIYEKGSFSVHKEDGRLARIYVDTKGTGVFDEMHVHENNVRFIYRLNDLTWGLVDEQPYPEALKTLEDGLLNMHRVFSGNTKQIDTNESLDNSSQKE